MLPHQPSSHGCVRDLAPWVVLLSARGCPYGDGVAHPECVPHTGALCLLTGASVSFTWCDWCPAAVPRPLISAHSLLATTCWRRQVAVSQLSLLWACRLLRLCQPSWGQPGRCPGTADVSEAGVRQRSLPLARGRAVGPASCLCGCVSQRLASMYFKPSRRYCYLPFGKAICLGLYHRFRLFLTPPRICVF